MKITPDTALLQILSTLTQPAQSPERTENERFAVRKAEELLRREEEEKQAKANQRIGDERTRLSSANELEKAEAAVGDAVAQKLLLREAPTRPGEQPVARPGSIVDIRV